METTHATAAPSTATSDATANTLQRNVVAVMVATVVTGGLGLVYWGAAARLYPAAAVGQAAGVINAALMLGNLANLGLGGVLERFVPQAGSRTRSMMRVSFALSSVSALAVGALFVLIAPTNQLFDSTAAQLAFPLLVMTMAPFALLDQATSSLQLARWGAYKNVAQSVAKLLLVVVLAAASASAFSIVSSWMLPTIVGLLITGALTWHITTRVPSRTPRLPSMRAIASFGVSSFVLVLLTTLTPLVIPLITLHRLGREANAYFTVAWTLCAAFFVLLQLAVGPYVAAMSAHPEDSKSLTRRFLALAAVVVGGGSLFLAVAGPLCMRLVGAEYARQTTDLLRLSALILLPALVGALYVAIARIGRRMRGAIVAQLSSTIAIIVGCWFGVERFGLVGIPLAFLVAESLVALVVLVPTVRALRQMCSDPEAPPNHTTPTTEVR